MRRLRDLQSGFRSALLGNDEERIATEIVTDGLDAPARLAVYRHHVLASLTAALEATYPVVTRLVDRRFFAYLADRYIRAHPPVTPCLFEYGGELPAFVAAFPPCAHLPYLADVARLEWAMNVALHAPDVVPVDARALRAVAPETLAQSVMRLDPSLTLLESPWPVDEIWRANQPAADRDATVDLGAGGVRLEIRRVGDDVVFRALDRGAFVFRVALASGRTLEDAAIEALAATLGFDLADAVRALLDEAVLVA